MKLLFFLAAFLLTYGCLGIKGDDSDLNDLWDKELVKNMCNGNFSETYFSIYNGSTMNTTEKIRFVSIYFGNDQYYYGAGGWSGGFGGVSNLYDSNGELAIKLSWDDISNNQDPCFNEHELTVFCPKFVTQVECDST